MKIIRTLSALFLVFCISFTLLYGKDKITSDGLKISAEEYQGIITLWQIDSFEGGVGSRKQFLLKIARDFEKQHSGVLVMVKNYTKDGAEENFNNGIFPDMVSFGNGVCVAGMSELNVKNSASGGVIGGKTYATAWCRGGYVLIENKEEVKNVNEKMVVSQGEYTQPLLAVGFEKLEINDYEILKPFDAYVKFVSGKVKYLLGTQRDVNRLITRGMQVEIKPLNNYNDLYQYVCITSKDSLKAYYAQEFINFLILEKSQKQLDKIGMFSCFYQVDYQDEHLNKMQKSEQKATISAFLSSQTLIEMQRMSKLMIDGDKDAKIKIENLLI